MCRTLLYVASVVRTKKTIRKSEATRDDGFLNVHLEGK